MKLVKESNLSKSRLETLKREIIQSQLQQRGPWAERRITPAVPANKSAESKLSFLLPRQKPANYFLNAVHVCSVYTNSPILKCQTWTTKAILQISLVYQKSNQLEMPPKFKVPVYSFCRAVPAMGSALAGTLTPSMDLGQIPSVPSKFLIVSIYTCQYGCAWGIDGVFGDYRSQFLAMLIRETLLPVVTMTFSNQRCFSLHFWYLSLFPPLSASAEDSQSPVCVQIGCPNLLVQRRFLSMDPGTNPFTGVHHIMTFIIVLIGDPQYAKGIQHVRIIVNSFLSSSFKQLINFPKLGIVGKIRTQNKRQWVYWKKGQF